MQINLCVWEHHNYFPEPQAILNQRNDIHSIDAQYHLHQVADPLDLLAFVTISMV